MLKIIRTILLLTATVFMIFAGVISATVAVPHLREDMVEINVRPTLLRAVMLGLHFGTLAMFGFAGVTLIAAIRSALGKHTSRLMLAAIGLTYTTFGITAYILSASHHALGYLLIGLLILGAALIPELE